MDKGKSSRIINMNYEYLLTINYIDEKILHVTEYEKGKINGEKWTINEIKNNEIIENHSLLRTKNWMFQNYPELLI